MYGTKLAQMPNDLPMGLGERLPRAEEVRAADIARKEDSNARYRKVYFEQADQTFNHELAKLQNDELLRRQAEAREAEKNPPKAPWAPASPGEVLLAFDRAHKSYRAAGGCGTDFLALSAAYEKKIGRRFITWTSIMLAEFEQFAGQVGAEEAARARSTVEIGNAPKFKPISITLDDI